MKIYGLYYIVLWNNRKIHCILRGRIRKNRDPRYSSTIAVGDIVKFELNDDGTGVINKILNRQNVFSRKEKGRNIKEDIIACNLDLIVVIQSFKDPKINLRFVDRLLVRGKKERIPVLLCINKLDLATGDVIEYVMKYYADANIDIRMVSVLTGEGMKDFKKIFKKKISLFVGYSGVGKTSILNLFCPDLNLKTLEISKSTKKGRHSTSNVEMITMSNEISIIDTPGVRSFGLMDIEPHKLGEFFSDFSKYVDKCAFKSCTHEHEPDCEVRRHVENGDIFKDRYKSYLNILHGLKEYYEKIY